jgi:hypothetical protein
VSDSSNTTVHPFFFHLTSTPPPPHLHPTSIPPPSHLHPTSIPPRTPPHDSPHSPLLFKVQRHAALGRQQFKVKVEDGEGVKQGTHEGRPVEAESSKHAQHLHKVLSGEGGGEEEEGRVRARVHAITLPGGSWHSASSSVRNWMQSGGPSSITTVSLPAPSTRATTLVHVSPNPAPPPPDPPVIAAVDYFLP